MPYGKAVDQRESQRALTKIKQYGLRQPLITERREHDGIGRSTPN